MAIKNVQDLHASIAKVCPIDGVSGDGEIWFQASAGEAQKAAARDVLANFQDSDLADAAPPKIGPPPPPPKSIFEF